MSILKLEGAYENELAATGEFNAQAPRTALMLPNGQRVVLPTEVLLAGLGVTPRHEPEETYAGRPMPVADDDGKTTEAVIPLVEERIEVGKREVETARVRLRRETEEHVQTVSVALANVSWDVEHVPIDQVVETQPEIRQVGDTIIFPLVEEPMVVKRELWLREEVHVRKVTSTVEKTAEFPVKRDVLVESREEHRAGPAS